MRYKEDWLASKERLKAFWEGELIDRCCVSIKARHRTRRTSRVVAEAKTPLEYWADPEYIINRERARMEETYYAGESFPCIFLNLGASGHAGFFKGADWEIKGSVWFHPSHEDPESIEFDENSFLFRKTMELAKAFAEDSKGDYMISMPDTAGNADALSHLLGPEALLPAMLEEPEAVQVALRRIQTVYERTMREVYGIVRDVNEGGSCLDWLSTWAPGFHAQLQSDMSVMISNPMFREFILPELQAQSELLDYPLYHLDGVEQIRHLDDILSLPRLRAVQWTQVAGQPPCTNYFPELKKIQAAGKSLVIIVTPDQIQPIMEELSSKGLFLMLYGDDPDEADAIVSQVAKLTHD